ncbi:MAG TPA: serine hydrolase domain-containing protein [Steroidobacteraceae bacterium]|nr:serine hydrolase domain-containing protein [Steroidobacteraceae bacterium]
MIRRSDALCAWLSSRLTDYATQFGVVGASAAILHDGAMAEAATGSLNLSSSVAATSDSLFQIGSISKTFTTTLVLQLAEQGRLGIDDPVRKHLPYFSVASEQVSECLTLRHLLTHTNGIDGEFFADTGTDFDCIQKYVRACSGLGQVHAPGESTSYCNAAFVVLGALLEQVTGQSWDSLLRERILSPLGLRRTTTDYAELPRFRVAVGHVLDQNTERFAVSKRLHLPRGMGPTGATLHASAADLAEFGRSFVNGGCAPCGAPLLEAQSISNSLVPQADWPTTRWTQVRMGLGWQLHSWDGRMVFGHDGATFGQASYLRVMPDANLVVALLTNGGPAKNLYHALYDDIFGQWAGVKLPGAPKAPGDASFNVHRATGAYANALTQARVFVDGGQLKVKIATPQFAGVIADQIWPLAPICDDACLIGDPEQRVQDILVFHHFDATDGRARYVSLRHRDLPRLR